VYGGMLSAARSLAQQPFGLFTVHEEGALDVRTAPTYARFKERLKQRSQRGFGCDDVDGIILLTGHLLYVHKRVQTASTHQMGPECCFDGPGTWKITHDAASPLANR
jgi:hypothetical protein